MPENQQLPKVPKDRRFTLDRKKRPINWHYHRWGLAQRYLDSMQSGARSGIALFAERRQGKTEFLRKDVALLAEEMGASVVYVDFWASDTNPPQAFYQGVVRAINTHYGGSPAKLASVNVGVPKLLNATFDFTDREQETDVLFRCFEALRAFNNPIVLLLDEVQELATSRDNESFVRALRAQLQSNSHIINPIYTGSSQQLLAELFKSTKAALYQAANIEQLPSLGRDFVEYVVSIATPHVDGTIQIDDALDAFTQAGCRPRVLTDLLNMRLSGAEGSLCQLLTDNKNTLLEVGASGVSAHWKRLTEMDKALLKILACGGNRGLYTPTTLELIGELGVSTVKVNKPNVQASLKRLQEKYKVIFSTEHGSWLYLDSLDRAWVFDTKIKAEEKRIIDHYIHR